MITMRNRTLSRRGFSFIGLLIVLVILGYLSSRYFVADKVTQISQYQTNIQKSGDAACSVNRSVAQNYLTMWKGNHLGEKPTLDKLRKSGSNIPRCPGGYNDKGEYRINAEGEIACSVHGPFLEGEIPPERMPIPSKNPPSPANP